MKTAEAPNLSIIIPIYNVECYLSACLRSIENAIKSMRSVEVICVNDGSTDASGAIVDYFCQHNDNFRAIHKENRGYGHAINVGISESKSRYVTIVESDDLIAGNPYQRLVDILEGDPELAFVKTPYFIWEEGNIKSIVRLNPQTLRRETAPYRFELRQQRDHIKLNDFTESELVLMAPSIWSAVYRKNALKNANISVIETPGASYQDTYFSNLIFLSRLKHAYVDEPYYLYRYERPDSSRNTANRSNEIIDIFRETKSHFSDKEDYDQQRKLYIHLLYLIRMIWFFPLVAHGARFRVFQEFHDDFSEISNSPEILALLASHLSTADQQRLQLFLRGDYLNFTKTYPPHALDISPPGKATKPTSTHHVEFSLEQSIEKHIWKKGPILKWFGDGAALRKLQPAARPVVAGIIRTLKYTARVRARRKS